MSELPAAERIILAVDTSNEVDAERLVGVAREAGARFVKLGLELSSATSWRYCSELAASHGLDWVADAKLDDIPNTVVGAVRNIRQLEHPPFGITMHTTAGNEAMRLAQEEAESIRMMGVTILTSIKPEEAAELYRASMDAYDIKNLFRLLYEDDDSLKVRDGQLQRDVIDKYMLDKAEGQSQEKVLELARNAAFVGLQGIVSSPLEVGAIKSTPETQSLFAMIPGTRSASADVQDQARVGTPTAAIKDGADLLVIGRQITQAADPAEAYEALVAEIEGAL